ncbi:uncharacterized protein LOC111005244 [Momordica charantia]|uniref:Uncharacterized protein LOC111005244 n=1 Tax=Momordica charantia TaxID=3673 RepID=A0A6J1BW23_MOMCH|nr:uncharacterized protein LOC111005244 [Momordica charantia]
MTVSLEALAMAGMDSGNWGVDFDEWETQDSDQYPPPYLLAEGPDNEAEEPNWVDKFGAFPSHRRKVGGGGVDGGECDDGSFVDIIGAGSDSSECECRCSLRR